MVLLAIGIAAMLPAVATALTAPMGGAVPLHIVLHGDMPARPTQPQPPFDCARRNPLSALTARKRFCPPLMDADEELGGASLNEEASVTVYYLGGAASRQRRVRKTRRPPPEERWRESARIYSQDNAARRMSAFCSYLTIDLEVAVRELELKERFRKFGDKLTITSYSDVVHCAFYSSTLGTRNAFIFPLREGVCSGARNAEECVTRHDGLSLAAVDHRYGSVLLWGFSADEELTFIDSLKGCSEPIAPIAGSPSEDIVDSEFMLFQEPEPDHVEESEGIDTRATISNNVIALRTRDAVEKIAISFAFAQSAKLASLEAALDVTIEEIRGIPEQLARTGRSQFTAKQVAKLAGRVFLERNEANLYSNILDCPDFFWEAEGFEPLYRRVNRYLDVEDRVLILNKRLDIVNDLLDSLSGQLEIRNSHRLEIVIIVLIMLEIILELAKESTPIFSAPVHLLRRAASIAGFLSRG